MTLKELKKIDLKEWIQFLDFNFLSQECSRHFIVTGNSNYGKSVFALNAIIELLEQRQEEIIPEKLEKHFVFRREQFQEAIKYAMENYRILFLDEVGQYFSARKFKENTDMLKIFELDRIFGILVFAINPSMENIDVYIRERSSFRHIRMMRNGGGLAFLKPFGMIETPVLKSDNYWLKWFKTIEKREKRRYIDEAIEKLQ